MQQIKFVSAPPEHYASIGQNGTSQKMIQIIQGLKSAMSMAVYW
jgi:hypothetical protein